MDKLTTRRLPGLLLTCALLAVSGCAGQRPAPAASVDFQVLGNPQAKVALIEFTDLQCPYCARFATTVFPELRRRYIDTGKVRFESYDMPLSFHRYAMAAAIAARCAGEQGKYWEFREALFRNQADLPSGPYDALAKQFGLDLGRYTECRRNPRTEAAVRADLALARQNGFDSTPTFVVGRVIDGGIPGELIRGAQPLEFFVAKLDALLAQ